MSEKIINEYNSLIIKYTELLQSCNNYDFSSYFKYNLKEVINWLINNKTEDIYEDTDDEEEIEYYKNLNSKENIQCLFNNFYWVFKFEFNAMIYHKKYPYDSSDLNKLSNDERLKLINECIDYFCDFYKEYIQKLFINNIMSNNHFIFLSDEYKNKYLQLDNSSDRSKLNSAIFYRIRFNVIDYYIKDIDYIDMLKDKNENIILYVFKDICEKMFDKNFVKKFYTNKQMINQFKLYFINIKNLKNRIENCYDFNIPKKDIINLM